MYPALSSSTTKSSSCCASSSSTSSYRSSSYILDIQYFFAPRQTSFSITSCRLGLPFESLASLNCFKRSPLCNLELILVTERFGIDTRKRKKALVFSFPNSNFFFATWRLNRRRVFVACPERSRGSLWISIHYYDHTIVKTASNIKA